MLQVLLVGAGGFLGAILRYALGGWVHDMNNALVDNPCVRVG
jgi:fluoride ion exporter CrcB/FEX